MANISYSIVIFTNLVIPCKNIYRFYIFCFLFAYLLDLMALQIFLRKTFLSVLLVTTTTMDIHLQAISKSLLSLYVFFCHTFVKLLFFKYYLSDSPMTSVVFLYFYARGLDILFSSNHNIHKSSCGHCFLASDPLIERF